MKKTFTGIIAVFAAVILAGCNNSSNTAVSQSDVTSAIQAKDYGKAEGLNEAILLSKKDDKTAKATDKQLKAMTKAEKAIADYNFDSAKDDLQTAIDTNDGSKTLVSQAKSRQKQVNTYIKQTSTYNKLLDQAKSSFSDKDYAATESTLKELLGDSDINDAAYTPIYKAALELRANNALAQTGTTSSSSSSSATSSSSNPAANSPENKPVQGSTSITDADLAQARTDLKALGQNPEYWSPSDLQRAILKMRAANRTHLNADDIK